MTEFSDPAHQPEQQHADSAKDDQQKALRHTKHQSLETLAVVIPVYNEQEIIYTVLEDWCTYLKDIDADWTIHVYNDGSTDKTLHELKRAAKDFEKIKVHDKHNSGHGPTILQGYLENTNCDWIFQVDSDNEMKPFLFKKLWYLRDSHDFIIAKRYLREWPLARRIVSIAAKRIVTYLYGGHLSDVNSPYRLMRVEYFKHCFVGIPRKTFAPNLILSGFALAKKLRTAEIDVPHDTRATGEVSIRKFKLFKAACSAMLQTVLFRISRLAQVSESFDSDRASHQRADDQEHGSQAIPASKTLKSYPSGGLRSWQECSSFSIETIWDLYRKYFNFGQVELISSFGFGRDRVKSAQGSIIYTESGKSILDFTGGIGVLNHGHNHPRILAARKAYQDQLKMEVHKNYFSPYVAGLAENIAKLLPEDLDVSYFCNSGAEAVEGCLKMAFKHFGGERKTILSSDISFHGKTLGAASVTNSPELSFKFPHVPGSSIYRYNDIEHFRQVLDQHISGGQCDVYAAIVEPMNASTMRQCSTEFLKAIKAECGKYNIPLIFDEVYTGWGKTGELFYFFHHGVTPDMVTYAKSFGGGKSSISGYTVRKPYFDSAYGNLADATLHSTTYHGFGEETITAIEAINVLLEERLVERASAIGDILQTSLDKLQKKYPTIIKEVRGRGALYGLLLHSPALSQLQKPLKFIPSKMLSDPRFVNQLVTASVISHLYDQHHILTFYGSNREIPLILSPTLVTTDHQIEKLHLALDQTFSQGLISLVSKFALTKIFSKSGSNR